MSTLERFVDHMPILLKELNDQPVLKRPQISAGKVSIPRRGIYALFENGRPIYVGRSNNIKRRLSGHSNQGSDRSISTFAFKLAIKEFESRYHQTTVGIKRQDLKTNSDFAAVFAEAKTRVSEMGIKAVGVDDPVAQTVFEVYAAVRLGTLEFNSFDDD